MAVGPFVQELSSGNFGNLSVFDILNHLAHLEIDASILDWLGFRLEIEVRTGLVDLVLMLKGGVPLPIASSWRDSLHWRWRGLFVGLPFFRW